MRKIVAICILVFTMGLNVGCGVTDDGIDEMKYPGHIDQDIMAELNNNIIAYMESVLISRKETTKPTNKLNGKILKEMDERFRIQSDTNYEGFEVDEDGKAKAVYDIPNQGETIECRGNQVELRDATLEYVTHSVYYSEGDGFATIVVKVLDLDNKIISGKGRYNIESDVIMSVEI